MPLSEVHPWLQKAAQAVAIAGLLAGGSAVISNKIDNVRQDEQLKQIEEVKENLSQFNKQIIETDKNLAVLNERLKNILGDSDGR